MDNINQKCEKCRCVLKQSGPYSFKKGEGVEINTKPLQINYWCMNQDCEMFNKNIRVCLDYRI